MGSHVEREEGILKQHRCLVGYTQHVCQLHPGLEFDPQVGESLATDWYGIWQKDISQSGCLD